MMLQYVLTICLLGGVDIKKIGKLKKKEDLAHRVPDSKKNDSVKRSTSVQIEQRRTFFSNYSYTYTVILLFM